MRRSSSLAVNIFFRIEMSSRLLYGELTLRAVYLLRAWKAQSFAQHVKIATKTALVGNVRLSQML